MCFRRQYNNICSWALSLAIEILSIEFCVSLCIFRSRTKAANWTAPMASHCCKAAVEHLAHLLELYYRYRLAAGTLAPAMICSSLNCFFAAEYRSRVNSQYKQSEGIILYIIQGAEVGTTTKITLTRKHI